MYYINNQDVKKGNSHYNKGSRCKDRKCIGKFRRINSRKLTGYNRSRNIGINLTITPGVTEIYRNGRLTGESAGGFTVGTGVSYSEKDYVAKVKTTIGEATGVNVNGVRADLTDINRDVNNRVEIVRDREVNLVDVDLGTEYWATSYGREKFNNDVNQARNKVERVSEIMKAMIENENKDIGLYYRDRLDFEATRDDMERRGLTDGFIIDEMIGRALAELSAEQGIDDLQIISLDDPNIKEIVGAEAIAGRAYHTGDGVVVIVADNIEDFASAIGTITEEGRHIYHRNSNGLEDSEDYASFYGEQFENYYNRVAGDTPLVMIGSELGYNAGQLGNDWEDKVKTLYGYYSGEIGGYFVVKRTIVLGLAKGDKDKNESVFVTVMGGAGVGGGASNSFGGSVSVIETADYASELSKFGGSIGINFTTGVLSFGISAEIVGHGGGISASAGPGGGASGSVTAQIGYTFVGGSIGETMKKIPNVILPQKLKDNLTKKFNEMIKGKKL